MTEYESGVESLFEETESTAEEEQAIPASGLCSKCMGSGYQITKRNGVLGVLFTTTANDSEGKPVKRLLRCDCKIQVSY